MPCAGSGSDEEEEEEDLMGDQSWAQTDDFSGAMGDLMGDLLADMEAFKADAEAAGVDINAKISGMDDLWADMMGGQSVDDIRPGQLHQAARWIPTRRDCGRGPAL